MPRRQVLLVCSKYLFGEGLLSLLEKADEIDVIGPWDFEDDFIDLLSGTELDVVVVAHEDPNSKEVVRLTNSIMHGFPDLPVIRVGLTQNIFYIVETHAFPASSSDLIETILGLPGANSWHK